MATEGASTTSSKGSTRQSIARRFPRSGRIDNANPELVFLKETKFLDPKQISVMQGSEARMKRMERAVDAGMTLAAEQVSTGLVEAHIIGWKPWFYTFTYRPDQTWEAGDIKGFFKPFEDWLLKQTIKVPRLYKKLVTDLGYKVVKRKRRFFITGLKAPYVWIAELQERCEVHYHATIWLPKALWSPPNPSKEGWWTKGRCDVRMAKKNVKDYMSKRTSKAKSRSGRTLFYPKGCRICGTGNLKPSYQMRYRWRMAPGWLRKLTNEGDQIRRQARNDEKHHLPGWQWLYQDDPAWDAVDRWIFVPSPWRVVYENFDEGIIRIAWKGWSRHSLLNMPLSLRSRAEKLHTERKEDGAVSKYYEIWSSSRRLLLQLPESEMDWDAIGRDEQFNLDAAIDYMIDYLADQVRTRNDHEYWKRQYLHQLRTGFSYDASNDEFYDTDPLGVLTLDAAA